MRGSHDVTAAERRVRERGVVDLVGRDVVQGGSMVVSVRGVVYEVRAQVRGAEPEAVDGGIRLVPGGACCT